MNKHSLKGIVASLGLFGACFVLIGNQALYWNVIALTVVLSGTLGALFLSFSFYRIQRSLKSVYSIFFKDKLGYNEIADKILELSVLEKCRGPESCSGFEKKEEYYFLKEASALLADNYKSYDIVDILKNYSLSFKYFRMQDVKVFRFMSSIAPAFGVAGSMICLAGFLVDVSNLSLVTEYFPIALIFILYGILLRTLVFVPLAENIEQETEKELLNHKLIMKGIVEIAKQTHPYKLARKIASFLPAQGDGFQVNVLRQKVRSYALQTSKQ